MKLLPVISRFVFSGGKFLSTEAIVHQVTGESHDAGVTSNARLVTEVLNFSGGHADEDRKLDIVAEHMHLRRDPDTVSISQRLQQAPCPSHGDFDRPGVID